MKRFFIVLALLVVGLTIAGCGGGGSTTLSSNPHPVLFSLPVRTLLYLPS